MSRGYFCRDENVVSGRIFIYNTFIINKALGNHQTLLSYVGPQALDHLVPAEREDDYDIIIEIQAGVGGQEAMLFASELVSMYENYSAYRGWQCIGLNSDRTDMGKLEM